MSEFKRTGEKQAEPQALREPGRSAFAAAPAVATTLTLQRSAGNRAVSRLESQGRLSAAGPRALARTPIQVRGSTTQPMVGGGAFVGTTRFEVDFVGDEAKLKVKIRLRNGAGVTDAELAATQARAAATFNAMWDNRFILTDSARNERYFLRTEVEWVNSGQHITVLLRSGDHDIDQTRWSVGDQSIEFAHEISHTLGLIDEYVDPRAVRRRTATSPGVRTDHSLMGNYFTEGIALAEVKLRSGQTVADISAARCARGATSSPRSPRRRRVSVWCAGARFGMPPRPGAPSEPLPRPRSRRSRRTC